MPTRSAMDKSLATVHPLPDGPAFAGVDAKIIAGDIVKKEINRRLNRFRQAASLDWKRRLVPGVILRPGPPSLFAHRCWVNIDPQNLATLDDLSHNPFSYCCR